MTNDNLVPHPALRSLNVLVRGGRLTKFKGRVASIAPGLLVVATAAVLFRPDMHMAKRLSTTLSVFLLTAACLSDGGQSTDTNVPEIDAPETGGPGEDGSDADGPNVSGPISFFRSDSQAEAQVALSDHGAALIGGGSIDTRVSRDRPTGGFEFIVGQNPVSEDVIALATFYPGALSEPGGGPTSGTVRYRGDFILGHITGIDPNAEGSSATPPANVVNGTVSLNVSFSDGAFSGTGLSDGALGDTLVLDGQLDTNGAMNGTATFAGVTADLQGEIFGETLKADASTAVGAFAGRTDTEVLVGGFNAINNN